MRTRLVIERLLMALLLPIAMLGLAQRPIVTQIDASIHDRMLRLASHTATPDIMIIAIDERSLGELGRWPWSRETHARLLERLAPHAPRAVLLDLFLTEPSINPRDDERLAQAAVHAAMAGRTAMVVGRWHGRFVHIPIPVATGSRNQVDPNGDLWMSVLEATGQPERLS